MRILDLTSQSRHKASGIILREYGGRYKLKDALSRGGIGIGRLLYIDGIAGVDRDKEVDKYYKANIEIYRNGIGIYIYNVDDNYLVLLDKEEIKSIHISKPLDVIKPSTFSFFQTMMSLGIDYYKCRYMLLEHEIVEYHPVHIDLHLADDQVMKMQIKKSNPYKHLTFFKNNPHDIPVREDIHGHLLLDTEID